MENKNLLLYITLGVLGLFTIIYFVIASNVSHAFSYDNDDVKYQNTLTYLKTSAELYAKNHPEIFNEKETVYISVDDLVTSKTIPADDEEGNIKDPTSEVKVLNDLRIRLTNKNGKIITKVLDN